MNLQLIPPKPEFAEVFVQWRNEPQTLKYNPVKNRSVEDLRQSLSEGPHTIGTLEPFKIYRCFILRDEVLVGTVSLSELNLAMGLGEIGYMVGEQFQNQGIATQALRAWVAKLFAETPLRKLTANVAESNLGSVRVLEKVGFVREGLLRDQYLINGQPTSHYVYGLLRSEFK